MKATLTYLLCCLILNTLLLSKGEAANAGNLFEELRVTIVEGQQNSVDSSSADNGDHDFISPLLSLTSQIISCATQTRANYQHNNRQTAANLIRAPPNNA